MIGLRIAHEFAQDESLRAETVVLDLAQQPVRRAPVRVEVFERRTSSHRKRLVGGFYAYEHVEEVKLAGTLCEGRTDRKGRFACAAAPGATGNLVPVARSGGGAAGEGDPGAAQREVFVSGAEESWFAAGDAGWGAPAPSRLDCWWRRE